MLNNFDFVSKSGARANGPYRAVSLYMLESHGPPGKKPNMETPVLPALCTSPTKTNMRCVASAIQVSTIAGNACKENDSIDNGDFW